MATDHSPCPPSMKQLESGNFKTAWGGIASLSMALPVMWTEASQRGFTLADIARWMSEGPARLAGCESRNGRIAAGYDADFVVFDPEAEFAVTRSACTTGMQFRLTSGRNCAAWSKQRICGGGLCFQAERFRVSRSAANIDRKPGGSIRNQAYKYLAFSFTILGTRFFRAIRRLSEIYAEFGVTGERIIGLPAPRKEGRDKVTGRARYVDDITLPGMLYGATVRSRIPRGKIKKITFGPGIRWGEFVIVCAKDIPGKNYIALIENDQPCLADGVVNHPEEPILLLAHPDRYALPKAVEAVHIEYDSLPTAFTIEESEKRSEIVWGTDNTFKTFLIQKAISTGFGKRPMPSSRVNTGLARRSSCISKRME